MRNSPGPGRPSNCNPNAFLALPEQVVASLTAGRFKTDAAILSGFAYWQRRNLDTSSFTDLAGSTIDLDEHEFWGSISGVVADLCARSFGMMLVDKVRKPNVDDATFKRIYDAARKAKQRLKDRGYVDRMPPETIKQLDIRIKGEIYSIVDEQVRSQLRALQSIPSPNLVFTRKNTFPDNVILETISEMSPASAEFLIHQFRSMGHPIDESWTRKSSGSFIDRIASTLAATIRDENGLRMRDKLRWGYSWEEDIEVANLQQQVVDVERFIHYVAAVQSTQSRYAQVFGRGGEAVAVGITRRARNLLPLAPVWIVLEAEVAPPGQLIEHSLRVADALVRVLGVDPEWIRLCLETGGRIQVWVPCGVLGNPVFLGYHAARYVMQRFAGMLGDTISRLLGETVSFNAKRMLPGHRFRVPGSRIPEENRYKVAVQISDVWKDGVETLHRTEWQASDLPSPEVAPAAERLCAHLLEAAQEVARDRRIRAERHRHKANLRRLSGIAT